jgi:hypothetical protein
MKTLIYLTGLKLILHGRKKSYNTMSIRAYVIEKNTIEKTGRLASAERISS